MAESVEIARQAYEAFNRGGVDAVLEFLDPEIEWCMWDGFSRGERVFRGHDGVRKVFTIFNENYDGFRADPQEFIDGGELVVVPVRLSGRAKGSGAYETFDVVQVWSARDNKAVRLEVYSDKVEALRATGVVPPE